MQDALGKRVDRDTAHPIEIAIENFFDTIFYGGQAHILFFIECWTDS